MDPWRIRSTYNRQVRTLCSLGSADSGGKNYVFRETQTKERRIVGDAQDRRASSACSWPSDQGGATSGRCSILLLKIMTGPPTAFALSQKNTNSQP